MHINLTKSNGHNTTQYDFSSLKYMEPLSFTSYVHHELWLIVGKNQVLLEQQHNPTL